MLRHISLSLLILIIVALVAPAVSSAEPESETKTPKKQLSSEQQVQFLHAKAPTIHGETFADFADALTESGLAPVFTSSAKVKKIRLHPIWPESYRPTFAELFEAIARQTGTTMKYDNASNRWAFDPPAMPLPYSLTLAKGWRTEDRGDYTAYIPSVAPVGMDIYMIGRYQNLSDAQVKQLNAEHALKFADMIRSGATTDDMKSATVDGCEALTFVSKAPMAGRQWRQWAFFKSGEAFVIVSTYDDANTSKIVADVDSMVASFHVLEPAPTCLGF
jgi:hypothetical protein